MRDLFFNRTYFYASLSLAFKEIPRGVFRRALRSQTSIPRLRIPASLYMLRASAIAAKSNFGNTSPRKFLRFLLLSEKWPRLITRIRHTHTRTHTQGWRYYFIIFRVTLLLKLRPGLRAIRLLLFPFPLSLFRSASFVHSEREQIRRIIQERGVWEFRSRIGRKTLYITFQYFRPLRFSAVPATDFSDPIFLSGENYRRTVECCTCRVFFILDIKYP